MNASQAPGGQIYQSGADGAVVVDADGLGFAFGNEPVGDRLAGVALLHADGQAGEVVDVLHVRQARVSTASDCPDTKYGRTNSALVSRSGVTVVPAATQS
jgi:hypothetical protein